MDLHISSEALSRLLARVSAIAAPKHAMTVLTHVLLEARDGELVASATDLNVGITARATAEVKDAGAVVVPAKRAAEIAKALPHGPVRMRVVKTQLEITSGRSKFKVPFIEAKEFPPIPRVPADIPVASCAAAEFARVLSQGSYAMYPDEKRPEIHVALLELNDGILRVVSADGKRMAVSEGKVIGSAPRMLVPAKTVSDVRRLCESQKDNPVEFTAHDGHGFFMTGDAALSIKLGDSPFPPWQKLIPKSCEQTVTVHRESLIDTIKRVALMVTAEEDRLLLKFSHGLVSCLSESSAVNGESEDSLDCNADFELTIAANPALLCEALAWLSDDDARIGFSGEFGAIVINTDEYKAVVMPQRRKGR